MRISLLRVFLVTVVLVLGPDMVVPETVLALSIDPLAEGKTFLAIGRGVDPAPPKLRDQELDHFLEGSGRGDVPDVESV